VQDPNPLLSLRGPVTQDGKVGIELNGEFIAGRPQGVPVQGFAFDRRTAELLPNTGTGGFSDMTQIASWIDGFDDTTLVVIQTVAGQAVTAGGATDFNAAIAKIGAEPAWQAGWNLPPAPFAVVGVPGLDPGDTKQTCGAFPQNSTGSCGLNGYLVLNALRYGFAWGDYVPFETKPAGTQNGLTNTMTVGSQDIASPAPPSGVQGGYHVVTVDRYDLQLLSNDAYWTNASEPTQFRDTGDMANRLQAAATNPTVLVFVASLGQPIANPEPMLYNQYLLPPLERLGGNRDVFISSRAGTYSLAGAGGLIDNTIEASNIIAPAGETPQPAGRIEGMLARNNQKLFEPELGGPGTPNLKLFQIAYQPPSPWPHSDAPDYAAASKWFAQQLLVPQGVTDVDNVRDAYDRPNLKFDAGTVKGLEYPHGQGFSETTFLNLQGDYETEFPAVTQVMSYLYSDGGFRRPFTDTSLPNYVAVGKVASDIEKALEPPNAAVGFLLTDIFNEALSVSSLEAEEFEVGDAVFGIVSDFATEADGSATAEIDTTAQQLAATLPIRVTDTLAAFDSLADIIVHDHDKLLAANSLFGSLNWITETADAVGRDILAGTRSAVYAALMPLAWSYSPGKATYFSHPAADFTDMRTWRCSAALSTATPYRNLPASAQYVSEATLTDAGQPQHSVWWWVQASGPGSYTGGFAVGAENCLDESSQPLTWNVPYIPPASLTDPLFAPAGTRVPGTDTRGVGLYRPWFWQRNFAAHCWRTRDTRCAPLPDEHVPAPAWSRGN
jgi:hypothetical protein